MFSPEIVNALLNQPLKFVGEIVDDTHDLLSIRFKGSVLTIERKYIVKMELLETGDYQATAIYLDPAAKIIQSLTIDLGNHEMPIVSGLFGNKSKSGQSLRQRRNTMRPTDCSVCIESDCSYCVDCYECSYC
jgi:hypothetical protein